MNTDSLKARAASPPDDMSFAIMGVLRPDGFGHWGVTSDAAGLCAALPPDRREEFFCQALDGIIANIEAVREEQDNKQDRAQLLIVVAAYLTLCLEILQASKD